MASGTAVNEVVGAPVQEKVPGRRILAHEREVLRRRQVTVDAAYDNYDDVDHPYDNYDDGLYNDR